MRGRHRPPRRKAEWKKRAEVLAVDLSRSEQAREDLMKARNRILEDCRILSGQLAQLQRELGSEAATVPVQLLHPGRPVSGLVPLQRPDGKRVAVQVGRPSQGRSRPTWATG